MRLPKGPFRGIRIFKNGLLGVQVVGDGNDWKQDS